MQKPIEKPIMTANIQTYHVQTLLHVIYSISILFSLHESPKIRYYHIPCQGHLGLESLTKVFLALQLIYGDSEPQPRSDFRADIFTPGIQQSVQKASIITSPQWASLIDAFSVKVELFKPILEITLKRILLGRRLSVFRCILLHLSSLQQPEL